MKVLVLFSDPPGQQHLRLDKEDNVISRTARRFEDRVRVVRLHASQVDDIRNIIIQESFDVVHFSGHGNAKGLFLDKSDMSPGGDLVSVARLKSLMSITEISPKLAIILCCYSNDLLTQLVDIAPHVITALGPVDDPVCIEFVGTFYERYFQGYSIKKAFDDALNALHSKGLKEDGLRLSRRQLILQGNSKIIQSIPHGKRNTILVNVDAVDEHIESLGVSREEVYHYIARRLTVHYWIFSVPRERCIISVGRGLFGEFSWENADDIVYCRKLIKARDDVPSEHWQVWRRILTSYNDLASSEYRKLIEPTSPLHLGALETAISDFQRNISRYLLPSRNVILDLGLKNCIPLIEFVVADCEAASDHFALRRFPQTIQSLEEALMNYHEIVNILQPKSEAIVGHPTLNE